MKTIIKTEKAPTPIGPYNQAILQNGTLYVSGQIAINPLNNELEINTIEEEIHQVMQNLKTVIEAANMDMSNVVKCGIFVSDMNNFAKINKIYGSYFTTNFPARETVEVARLPKNVNVEISAIAVM